MSSKSLSATRFVQLLLPAPSFRSPPPPSQTPVHWSAAVGVTLTRHTHAPHSRRRTPFNLWTIPGRVEQPRAWRCWRPRLAKFGLYVAEKPRASRLGEIVFYKLSLLNILFAKFSAVPGCTVKWILGFWRQDIGVRYREWVFGDRSEYWYGYGCA